MPFQRVPDTVEIIVEGVSGDQQIINTFYGQKDGGYTLADLINLADDVDTWVGTDWLPLLSAAYTYLRTTVRGLNAAIDLIATADASAGAGTVTGTSQANNVCLAVKRSSGMTGRGARGRIFVPNIADANLSDDNHVSSTFAAAIVEALTVLDTVISAADFLPVIVHRVSGGVPLTEAVVFTLVEWVVTDLVVDSMRRRLPKRGS